MKIKKIILSLVCSCCLLSSCMGSSITSIAGNAATSERGINITFDDTFIYTKIKANLLRLSIKNLANVNVTVSNGRVLLIGELKNNEERLKIVKEVWKVKGVKEVYNELLIGDNYSVMQKTKDLWLSSKIKTILLFDSKIYTNNFSLEVFDSVVYLIGISRNLEENQKIEQNIKEFSGVKKLISFIKQSKEDFND